MPSLSPKDRVSLCQFTFADGRRCRTPRTGNHPYFCFDHAQKEARAHAAESLGKDLTYFFSGDYLSACDLATALGRLLPAVVCGDVNPEPPAPSPTWPKPSCRPSISPSTNTSTPLALTAGAIPSATPSTATTTTAFPRPPNPSSPNHRNLNPNPFRHRPHPNQLQPNNPPHRRTLPCLPRPPNSPSNY